MKVSKSLFQNLIRCPNFATLHEAETNKEKAIIDFDENQLEEERKEKLKSILDAMFPDGYEDDDKVSIDDTTTKALLAEFEKVELIVSKYMKKNFKGHISDASTKQKKASAKIDGYEFYSFFDVFQESDKEINIVEVKASTTSKLFKSKKIKMFKKDNFYNLEILVNGKLGFPIKKALISNGKQVIDKFATTTGDFKFFFDLAFQRYIFEQSHPTKKVNYYIALLNSKYEFDGKYEGNEPVYSDDVICLIDANDITKFIIDYRLKSNIDTVVRYLNEQTKTLPCIGRYCMRNKSRQCKFFETCLKLNQIPKDHNLFTFYSFHTLKIKDEGKFNEIYNNKIKNKDYDYVKSCYDAGTLKVRGATNDDLYEDFYYALNESDQYKTILDVKHDMVTDSKKREIQIDCLENNKKIINKPLINKFLNILNYPLYHLDFESLNLPLPRFKGEKPYTQSVFQYSIHIEKKPGVCDYDKENDSFLASNPHLDERKELVKRMCETIKDDNGSIIVFNESFEKSRIKEFAEYFPEYKDKLENILSRIVDLEKVFKSGNPFLGLFEEVKKEVPTEYQGYVYYDKDLQGRTSIKKVFPTLTKNNIYSKLKINQGTIALTEFYKSAAYTGKNLTEYRKEALKYCMQDTYSMFEILNVLRKESK